MRSAPGVPGAKRAGHGRNDGKHGDNERKGGPAALVLFVSAGEQHTEIGDHGYHDDRQPVKARRPNEPREVCSALSCESSDSAGIMPQNEMSRRNRTRHDDEHRNEQNDEPCLIHVDETEQSSEHHKQKDRADETSR